MTCDVFVIFGITGDLAKVMTFRSLYRLEERKLLTCPIVGVAVDDWTHEQLLDRARTSIIDCGEQIDEKVFARLAKRMTYVSGDFADAATYESVARRKGGSAPCAMETVHVGKHEEAHTWQYQVLGPFFLPVYALTMLLPSPTPFERAADLYAKSGSGWWPRLA